MTDQNRMPPEFAEWIVHSLDGTITTEQFARLEHMICTQPTARAYYLEFIMTYVGLVGLVGVLPRPVNWVLERDLPIAEESCEAVETLNRPESTQGGDDSGAVRLGPDLPEPERVRQIEQYARQQLEAFLEQQQAEASAQRTRRSGLDLGLMRDRVEGSVRWFLHVGIRAVKTAAVVGLVTTATLVLALYIHSHRTVGILVGSMDAQWNVPLDSEGRIRPQRLSLEQGYAQIQLGRGAEVILQAPSTFTLDSKNRMSLYSGWMTAKVPPSAKGFTVKAPGSSVVDYGTEFGLLAGADQRAEVHVFDGRIEYRYGSSARHQSGRQSLVQGQAATLDEEGRLGRTAVTDRPRLFVREMPVDSGFGIPGRRLDLADVIGGGNGLGTGVLSQGLDPSTGTATDARQLLKVDGRGFLPVPTLPFVDGVFVPDGNHAPVVITSTGLVFERCPRTNGRSYETVLNGATFRPGRLDPQPGRLGGRDYVTKASPSIGMHPNAGITYDLDQIRASMPDAEIRRFDALCGTSETVVAWAKRDSDPNKIQVDFWVLVDGRIRFSKALKAVPPQSARIGIDLEPGDRFLTLATTHPGEYQYCWALFAEASLELTAKREGPSSP